MNPSDDMAIEQSAPREAIAPAAETRRLLMWAQMDIMAGSEVSTARRLAAWIALGVSLLMALLLLLGY